MSQYFSIKKNGVNVFSFSRSSNEFKALLESTSYTEEWKELTKADVEKAMSLLKEKLYESNERINRYKEALIYLKTADDIYEQLEYVSELKEDIIGLEESIGILIAIEDTYYIYPFDDDGTTEAKLEYRVD